LESLEHHRSKSKEKVNKFSNNVLTIFIKASTQNKKQNRNNQLKKGTYNATTLQKHQQPPQEQSKEKDYKKKKVAQKTNKQ